MGRVVSFVEAGEALAEGVTPVRDGGCVRCGTHRNVDGSRVLWVCQSCGGVVCRGCTLTVPGTTPIRYYDATLCSAACWERAGSPED